MARTEFAELVAARRAAPSAAAPASAGSPGRPTWSPAWRRPSRRRPTPSTRHRREAATVAGRLAAVRAAASALHTADAECPVCRRDLSPDDVARADEAHEQEVAALRAQRAEARHARRGRVEAADRPADAEPAGGPAARGRTGGRRLRGRRGRGRVRGAGRPRGRGTARRARGGGAGPPGHARRAGRRGGAGGPRDPEAYRAHRREAVTGVAAEVIGPPPTRSSPNASIRSRPR